MAKIRFAGGDRERRAACVLVANDFHAGSRFDADLAVELFMSHAKIKPAGCADTLKTAGVRESACFALAVGINCPLVG